jgi:hypothetical protein
MIKKVRDSLGMHGHCTRARHHPSVGSKGRTGVKFLHSGPAFARPDSVKRKTDVCVSVSVSVSVSVCV